MRQGGGQAAGEPGLAGAVIAQQGQVRLLRAVEPLRAVAALKRQRTRGHAWDCLTQAARQAVIGFSQRRIRKVPRPDTLFEQERRLEGDFHVRRQIIGPLECLLAASGALDRPKRLRSLAPLRGQVELFRRHGTGNAQTFQLLASDFLQAIRLTQGHLEMARALQALLAEVVDQHHGVGQLHRTGGADLGEAGARVNQEKIRVVLLDLLRMSSNTSEPMVESGPNSTSQRMAAKRSA